jgi:hypothetical protein
MADVKRGNYFLGQFLEGNDLLAEQAYHVEMRRRLNRLRFGPGVLEGLALTKSAARQVSIAPGTAVDAAGREIVLLSPMTYDVVGGANALLYVTLTYTDKTLPEDQRTKDNYSGFSRITERPDVKVQPAIPAGGMDVVVGAVQLDASSNIASATNAGRQTSATIVGRGTGGAGLLSVEGTINAQGPITAQGAITGQAAITAQGTLTAQNTAVIGTAAAVNIGAGVKLHVAGDAAITANATVGAGANGVLKVRHINGKSVGNDDNDGLYLQWATAKDVNVGGGGTDSNLIVNGNLGVKTAPRVPLHVVGAALISDGDGYAAANGRMAKGSLTIGSITANFGGGNSWNANTAGLLLETAANTEIAVHDAGTRITSLMYYEGDATNRITIGRDMGWGTVATVALNGNVGIGTNAPAVRLHVEGEIQWGNSRLSLDQGGSIELGTSAAGMRTPYIDFHATSAPDYSARIINEANGLNLRLAASRVHVQGVLWVEGSVNDSQARNLLATMPMYSVIMAVEPASQGGNLVWYWNAGDGKRRKAHTGFPGFAGEF